MRRGDRTHQIPHKITRRPSDHMVIFGDCFEELLPEKEATARQQERDPLEEAQARLLGLWHFCQ